MKTRPLAVALLVSLAPVMLPPRAAFAESADEASTKLARQRFVEGVAFYDKGQFDLARASFLQAYALHKHPAVLLNLAQSCLKSGHTLESARDFQVILRDSTATTAQKYDAEHGLREARTKLGRIDVSAAPSGAEIFVDEQSQGTAPIDPIDVDPGSHTVKARGRTDEIVSVTVVGGQLATAHFGSAAPPPVVAPLPPPPAAPAPEDIPPPAEPNAESSVEPTATPPVATQEEHHSGGALSPPSNLVPVFLLGGLAVAGFGTAIGMGIAKSSAQDSANTVASAIESAGGGSHACFNPTSRYANACSVLNDNDNRVNTDALIANIGLGVGIGAVVIGGLYWVLGSKDSGGPTTSSRPLVTPMIARDGGGMSVGGTF